MKAEKKKAKLLRRIQKILDTPIRVFHHSSFDDPKQRKTILAELPGLEKFEQDHDKVRKLRSKQVAPEMRPCYEAPLLNVDQEQHLFRQMNFYKYRAKKMLAAVNPLRMGENRVAKIEENLAKAQFLRNQIASSNFRLATQILKGQITFYREHTLTEALLSDGYFDVLKAVDYFNWTLGNRFSTYATWVVKKNFYRDLKQKTTYAERYGYLDDNNADKIESNGDGFEEEREYEDRKELVGKLLSLLRDAEGCADRTRQVLVLENYFGVNGKERQTLEGISKQIGVTKERVRQLKEKGLQWIQAKVAELGIEYDGEELEAVD